MPYCQKSVFLGLRPRVALGLVRIKVPKNENPAAL